MFSDYNIFQKTIALAMLADSASTVQGTQEEIQKAYYDKLSEKLQTPDQTTKPKDWVASDWHLAWGPVIWKLKPDEKTSLANAGFIAFHPKAKFEDNSEWPTYVIALAGTPPGEGGKHVISEEDEAMDSVVDFEDWVKNGIEKEPKPVQKGGVVSGKSYISKGTAWATHVLMKATSPGKEGQTMVQFLTNSLSSSAPQPTRLIVAGHSLGGTLTTTISLTLRRVMTNILSPESILAYPVAACTAGNVQWANQWAKDFPARKSPVAGSYEGWNLNLVNNLDCIPQLWCQMEAISPRQWMGRIPSLYGVPVVDEVWHEYALKYAKVSKSRMIYKPIPAQYFDGSPPDFVPANYDEFTAELLKQHTDPYYHEVGIPKIFPPKTRITNGLINPEDQKK